MAVYEHLYGAYEGESHSAWSRFLVIPRYALREVFKSKLLVTIFILCFIYPLIATILVYLRHNANALAVLPSTSATGTTTAAVRTARRRWFIGVPPGTAACGSQRRRLSGVTSTPPVLS